MTYICGVLGRGHDGDGGDLVILGNNGTGDVVGREFGGLESGGGGGGGSGFFGRGNGLGQDIIDTLPLKTYHAPVEGEEGENENGDEGESRSTPSTSNDNNNTTCINCNDGTARSTPNELNLDFLDEDEDCCCVCLETFTDDNPAKKTKCGHQYHLQ